MCSKQNKSVEIDMAGLILRSLILMLPFEIKKLQVGGCGIENLPGQEPDIYIV
jgi:hypothetical protein